MPEPTYRRNVVNSSAFRANHSATGSTSPAYSVSDVVGGKIEITGAFLGYPGTFTLTNLIVATRGDMALRLIVFSGDPGTLPADNAAYTWSNATHVVDVVTLADPVSVDSVYVSRLTDPIVVKQRDDDTSTSLFLLLIAAESATLTGTSINISLTGYQD